MSLLLYVYSQTNLMTGRELLNARTDSRPLDEWGFGAVESARRGNCSKEGRNDAYHRVRPYQKSTLMIGNEHSVYLYESRITIRNAINSYPTSPTLWFHSTASCGTLSHMDSRAWNCSIQCSRLSLLQPALSQGKSDPHPTQSRLIELYGSSGSLEPTRSQRIELVSNLLKGYRPVPSPLLLRQTTQMQSPLQ
jgi:hypothetical protein